MAINRAEEIKPMHEVANSNRQGVADDVEGAYFSLSAENPNQQNESSVSLPGLGPTYKWLSVRERTMTLQSYKRTIKIAYCTCT